MTFNCSKLLFKSGSFGYGDDDATWKWERDPPPMTMHWIFISCRGGEKNNAPVVVVLLLCPGRLGLRKGSI